MKKIIFVFLTSILLLTFVGCNGESAKLPGDTSGRKDTDIIMVETTKQSDIIVGEKDIGETNAGDTPKDSLGDNTDMDEASSVELQSDSLTDELSDELAIKIAENCFLTIFAEFDEDDIIPYSEIFNYYTFDGCYTSDREGIPTELVRYYNSEELKFSVPYEIADTFLSEKFNTLPDRNAVECFNPQTGCYEFDQHLGENYYELTLIDKGKRDTGDGGYIFTVEVKHYLTDEIPAEYHSFAIELDDNDYKILSRKIYSEQEFKS